jgi:TM2 domain-containing membrane protein YozV
MALMKKMFRLYAYLTGIVAVIVFIGVAFTTRAPVAFTFAVLIGFLAFWFYKNSIELPPPQSIENGPSQTDNPEVPLREEKHPSEGSLKNDGQAVYGAQEEGLPIKNGSKIVDQKEPVKKGQNNKNPLVGGLCSFLIPGLGQVYDGETERGIIIFFGTLVGSFVFLIPGLIVWLFGIYDAYTMAEKMNANKIPFKPTKKAHMILFVVLVVVTIVIIAMLVFLVVMAAFTAVNPPHII